MQKIVFHASNYVKRLCVHVDCQYNETMEKNTKISTKFDTDYKRLNTHQREAVDAIDGPVMVIAGPGTGKTTILTLRIANILRLTDTPANGILAITYTDAGVRAMREKLRGVIGDRAYDVRVTTFHGFASSVISEHPDHFIHLADMKQMTNVEQESLIRTILMQPQFAVLRPTGKPDAYVAGILSGIENSKREDMTPDKVRAFARDEIHRIKNNDEYISTRGATKGQLKAEAKEHIEKCEKTLLFADVYEQYEKGKRELDQMDFSDLIIELLAALRNDELLLRLIQEQYLYVHVDEHQDTNDSQNIIIALIAEFFETPNIFIVGDEKQAIYRFQGASVENFLLLQKHWPGMRIISLDTNYRSHQHILDASFSMIENNYEGDEYKHLRVRLSSGSGEASINSKRAVDAEESKHVEVVTGENTVATEDYLVKKVASLTKQFPQETIAIIVKKNRDLDRIIRILEANDIKVSSERTVDIFNHPIGQLFFDLIEYIVDPSRIDALAKTIALGLWGISIEEAATLIRYVGSGMTAKAHGQSLEQSIPVLTRIRSELLSDGPVSFLIHCAEYSGFTNLVAKDPSYVFVWRGIVALAESLVRESDIISPTDLIKSLLAHRQSAKSRIVKVTVGAPDLPLQAMTAHGSKGLEFDRVFIMYATDEEWIGKTRGSSFVLPKKSADRNDIRDIRRLFYVALTRAKKQVTILSSYEESDGDALTPLRFISELDRDIVTFTTLPRVDSDAIYAHEVSVSHAMDAIVDIAKRMLIEKGLSVTALNHFVSCPNKFIYQSVLKLPQALHPASEKGNAMHAALAKVWKLDARINGTLSKQDIETTIHDTVVDYFNESLLSKNDKDFVVKDLIEDIPFVAEALVPHFAIKADTVFTEFRMTGEFHGSYDKVPVHIPIHGNLDAVLDTGSSVYIFDYKAKKAMSEAAIRGDTKNDDGNYFRQLIFYKMLALGEVRMRDKRILPALVFVSPDPKGRCPTVEISIEHADILRVQEEIQTLVDSVWSGAIAGAYCSEPECEWCGMKRLS